MKQKLLCSALVSAVLLLAACGSVRVVAPANEHKNMLFFLGDGMGLTTMTAARIYAVGESGELTMDQLPETAFVHTFSRNAQVTDSAASMSAYMTGVKINSEVISMSADARAYDASGKPFALRYDSSCPADNGRPMPTLLEQMKAAGYATGVVTTTRITHATPATTYAHVCHRAAENTIAAALVPGGQGYNPRLGDGVDVILGGGRSMFMPQQDGGRRNDQRNLIAEFKAQNYSVALERSDFDQLPVDGHSKIVGLFTQDHMAYELDRNPSKEPSLAEMTVKAIDALAARKKGMFLMVEGGRIDHALHATTARYALQDTVAFDDAIKAALDKMQKMDPGLKHTLIVVTADHDHTMHLNGYAAITGKTEPGKPGVVGLVKNYVNGKTETDVNGNPYTIIGFGNGPRRMDARGPITDADLERKGFVQEAMVPQSSETHGGADVFLGAQGLGAENFSGVIDNTEVFKLIKKSIGL
ncbi:MAG: alkaline phosphatase [Acidovorax sp.]|jgi:alkaline phosphatase|nr:alkaline phosphatase [Acidovorax sp.]